MSEKKPPTISSRQDVSRFLEKVARTPVRRHGGNLGRLVFAMDATASREPTWDRACHLQGQMFEATADVGNLAVQLCYYRGFNEFHAGSWCESAASLQAEMSHVQCLGGQTQIRRVLDHAAQENRRNRIRAVVFVGDALEEDADALCHLAGQLGVMQLPLFMFQEGYDPLVRTVFQQMAHLSGGAFAPFDLSSASELKDLLSAVAVYATGGKQALTRFSGGREAIALLTHQLRD